MVLQVWLNDVEMMGIVKYLLINVIIFVVMIGIYYLLVCGIWIGVWLNGCCYGKKVEVRVVVKVVKLEVVLVNV